MKRFEPVWQVTSGIWPCRSGSEIRVHEVGGQTEFIVHEILSERHVLVPKVSCSRTWNVVEIEFTTTYLGMKGVRARWWERSDGKKFMSVDQWHLAELESRERERIQSFALARGIHSFAAYIAARRSCK